jgi:hypothetical protein
MAAWSKSQDLSRRYTSVVLGCTSRRSSAAAKPGPLAWLAIVKYDTPVRFGLDVELNILGPGSSRR